MPAEIERLYREHRAGLVRLVERELHDHDDAEDVVQTAFLDAQRALERGTIPRNPRAWLAAIALNAAHRLRRRRLNAEPLEDYAVREASGMPDIRAALTSLPREQRTAVLYRDVLGLSYDETAEQMGRSVNAVTMLLHRGRQRLRQTLGVTVGGLGLWRWVKRAGVPQMAAVKGAASVVVAAGLTTGGIAVARVVAPIGTDRTAALATHSGHLTAGAERTAGGALPDSARRHFTRTGGSSVSSASASTEGSRGNVLMLPVPTVPLPSVQLPTLPATIAATVTVSTPIAAATVTIPTGTTATVTTPVTTVTVPIP